MKRRIKITEAQARELAKRFVNEIALDGDEALANNNGNIQNAAREVITNAKKSGVRTDDNASVTFGGDALRKNAGISEERVVGKITKSQIKECKLNQLKDSALRKTNKKEL